MTAEGLQLTREQVILAERRIGPSHPVVATIDRYLPRIQQWNATCDALADRDKINRYINNHLGSLAKAFVKVPYTLKPLDIIQIWSKVAEVTPYGHYAFAEIISAAYGVWGLDNPAWKRFPRHYIEHTGSKLPKEVIHDETGLTHVRQRLAHVADSVSAIDSFRHSDHWAMWLEAKEAAKRRESSKALADRQVIEFGKLRE